MNKEQMLAEIRAYREETLLENTIQPGDLTYEDLEEALGYKHDTVRRVMLDLQKRGIYQQLRVRVNGRPRYVFRRMEDADGA